MSNKQKFLTVLSTMVQPQARSPKAAWISTEEAWDKNYELINKLSKEELAEVTTYAMMGLQQLNGLGEGSIFHDIIMDDMRTILHDQTCEHCKGKKDSECGTEAKQEERPGPTLRSFSSFEDLINQISGGGKKPS
jgi:hypothetical protein